MHVDLCHFFLSRDTTHISYCLDVQADLRIFGLHYVKGRFVFI